MTTSTNNWINQYEQSGNQPLWLKDHAAGIPINELQDYAYKVHSITTETIVAETPTLTLTKQALEAEFSGYQLYQKYLVFEVVSSTELELRLVTDFDANAYCFSIPLLTAIFEKQNLGASDTLVFTKAKVDGHATVVISVTKGSVLTKFNFTEEPI